MHLCLLAVLCDCVNESTAQSPSCYCNGLPCEPVSRLISVERAVLSVTVAAGDGVAVVLQWCCIVLQVNGTDGGRASQWKLPDNDDASLRLQRETDFLK